MESPFDAPGWEPQKALGQNYLTNAGVIEKMVDLVSGYGNRVIEIGAGKGALTRPLVSRFSSVLAVEPHAQSAQYLRGQLGDVPGFSLMQEDATKLDFSRFIGPEPTVVVGNLPYSVGARILFRLLQTGRNASAWILMFQKEVAQRITAIPGSRDYGTLSVVCALGAACDIRFHVRPGSFVPAPTVMSSVIRCIPDPSKDLEWDAFSRWLTRVFSMRRKQLGSILKALGYHSPEVFSSLSFPLTLRPEQLHPDQLFDLWLKTGS